MATDYALMTLNLMSFYDFESKSLTAIGSGGGRPLFDARVPRRILAVDQDTAALDHLRAWAVERQLVDKFKFVVGDFLTMDLPSGGDVVLFEFCLHEMADAALALTRAGRIAPDVLVLDHGRASEWAYCVAEEEKVSASWRVVTDFDPLEHREFTAEQRFANYAELRAKVSPQGDIAIRRIEKYKDETEISIPMTYELARLRLA